MNAQIRKNLRRIGIDTPIGIGWLVDLLSLLPPDTMVESIWWDVNTGQWVLYVQHPDFTETDPNANIATLHIQVELYRSLLGEQMTRPARLIDEVTGKNFYPV